MTLARARRLLHRSRTAVQVRFAPKDIITLFFSAAALVVSLSTLYVTQFRVARGLEARLAEFDGNAGGDTIVRFLVTNTGNRAAVLVSAHYMLSQDEKYEIVPWGGPSYDFNEQAGLQKAVPIVLQPHEVRLIEVGIANSSIIDAFSDRPAHDKVHNIYAAFRFLSLDNDGNPYDILTPCARTI
jgi:hypothetical protein